MKKKFSAFLVSLTAIILAVIMASGCSFISNSAKNNGTVSPSDSEVAAQSVNFNTTAKTRDIEDALLDAVEQVERSSVMIMTDDGGAGSGVIVDISFDDKEGDENYASWKNDDNIVYIVTCHHVIADEDTFGVEGIGKITVYIPDENDKYDNANYIFEGYIGNLSGKTAKETAETYAVTLVGGDFESDIALLKLDLDMAAVSGNKLSKDKIVKAQIPDFSSGYKVRKGETVFAIGNSTGVFPGTASSGIVSNMEVQATVAVSSTKDITLDMTLMQISVPTNPGSSGGGLYNLYGELIGITNAGASKSVYEGINFAIPCYLTNGNGFVEIVSQLGGTATETNYGYVSGRKVRLGFTVELENGSSEFVVSSVIDKSIAENAGLLENDVIKSINGTKIETMAEYAEVMDGLKAGDNLVLGVQRVVYSWSGRPSVQTKDISMVVQSFWFCNTNPV